ncbi:MAG TPA: PssD/Cps14F family polysaccharide biosynthesis glycosyltransferase [Stenomitos sp.]
MKLLLASTSGGHFATMRSLKSFWSLHRKVWVCDRKADTEILDRSEHVYWFPYQGPRDLQMLLYNLPQTFKVLWQEQPDVVISTGASIAINFCIAAKILGIRYVYIESISRSQSLSLTGHLVYWLSDEFYVQWPQLCTKYRKARFEGYAA